MWDSSLYLILCLGHQIALSRGVFFAYNKGTEMESSKFHLILQIYLKERHLEVWYYQSLCATDLGFIV